MHDHDSKANLLWQSYKTRLGTTDFSGIQFDLNQHFIAQRAQNLEQLIANFSRTDIDQVVKNLPSYKAPGPDGFNIDFTKNVGLSSVKISTAFLMHSSVEISVYRVLMDHTSL